MAEDLGPQLILVRHGQTEWSRSGRHTGNSDIPLTADGEAQAISVGVWLSLHRQDTGRNYGVVLTSPRSRARRTAILAGFPAAQVDDDLVEWDYGPVEGRTSNEVSSAIGRDWEIFRDGVGVLDSAGSHPGETLDDVAARASRVIDRVIPALQAGHDALVFSHGHLLRILTVVWLGASPLFGAHFELGTAALAELNYAHGLRSLNRWNLSAT